MAATHSTLHFGSGSTLKVVEVIAEITALVLPPALALPVWPSGVLVTDASSRKLWVNLGRVEWIEPS